MEIEIVYAEAARTIKVTTALTSSDKYHTYFNLVLGCQR